MKTATEKLIEQVESLVDSGEIGSGKLATMKALAKQARLERAPFATRIIDE